ncbi:VCBS repeat-containing protein [Streptomyces sp. R302]|uniref:FG-GAP repeat domain-containing protein n=1 Tax=unclassified Streptomyces TaxID=2593676 RepID=UPI00145E4F87|nr:MULTISPECIES: VCBS repeat-containing protein [unclassified Streptomyces]NML49965.1 VCBS repeat-containing protein [Streptomyces sp. R301]NML78956.1 VCBS repeat-containing protein [Streptomyces sp. R302]
MYRFTTRRGVSTAITTVLAATLGAGILSVPATAAPLPAAVTAESGTQDAAPVPYPANGILTAAGKTGFLAWAWVDGTRKYQWTRYADGAVTTLDAPVADSSGSDVIMTGGGQTPARSLVLQLHDMADGGRTVTIDLRPLNGVYVKAVSKDTVLAQVTKADGSVELQLVTGTGGTVTQRKVEGIPSGASNLMSAPARNGSALVTYYVKTETSWRREYAVVDLAAAKVVSTHKTDADLTNSSALSATHLVWAEDGGKVYTVDRATGVETVTDFGLYEGESMAVGLLGSWEMYGTPGTLEGDGTGDDRPLIPFTAKSLTSGEKVELVDYVTWVQPGPDNTLYVRGGSVEHGDGLYRISLGADGRPTAELVAATGVPVQLRYLGTQIPPTFDLASPIPLKWKLSRENADVALKITHRATGKSFSKTLHLYSESAGSEYYYGDGVFGITWAQIAAESQMGKDAEVGAYDWSFTATPQNGVGPAVEASGSFTAAKNLSSPHDLDWDGGPDLLARDAEGVLWRNDTTYDATKKTLVQQYAPDRVGGGWQVYDRIEAVGGIGGGAADFIARDTSGTLWLYDVTGNGYSAKIAPRKSLGGGWNTYAQITGGSDLTGDGRPDLVAADKAGVLWLYKGTGNVSAPFARRQKIGNGGWGAYNQLTATGNIGGAAHGDLVARDKAGVLWLYLGKGDGTFTARREIGGGWGAYTDTVAIGDANHDGRPDLFAYGPNKTSYFYAGTGDYRRPFAGRVATPLLTGNPAYNHIS